MVEQVLDELIHKYGGRTPLRIAVVYAWRGETDSAFDWLEQAYRKHDPALSLLQLDFGLSGVRGDPRYKALLRKMNFPDFDVPANQWQSSLISKLSD
jgi:hypothetical protein